MALKQDTRNRSTIKATDTLEQAAERVARADRDVAVCRRLLREASKRRDARDIGNTAAEVALATRTYSDTRDAYKALVKAAAVAEKAAAKAALANG